MSTQHNTPTPPNHDEVIRTERLTKVFPSNGNRRERMVAVKSLDLTVCRGEIFGLLGPNGAGKTTTVGMLTTRVIPSAGRAVINEVDVVAEPARAKQVIGVVQQVNTLDRSLTVWQNLYFHGRYFGMSAKVAHVAADTALERFRLEARAKADVHTLSGGMARRLMVARSILHNPAVLFLDEPTAGLDPQSRLALWDILSQLRAEGQTILLTTHYMEEADRFCDRVAILDHGQILALDTPARLKQLAGDGQGVADRAKARLAQLRALAAAQAPGRTDERSPEAEAALLQVVEAAAGSGLLEDLPEEVTLETVFINLTGRDLRE